MTPGQVRVNIFGTDYTLISDNNDNYVREVARYIDDKMREIDKNQAINSATKIAVLAALNIADELFQERQYRKKLVDQLNEEAKKVNQNILELFEE